MYGDVVLEVDHHHFEELLEQAKSDRGVSLDTDMTADDWKALVAAYKAMVAKQLGRPFPQDPQEQLWGAAGAVFASWMNQRANTYRRLHQIPEEWGTAVNIQAMVFGNMGPDCATGVAFTRDPSTGENEFYGEFLINAQGEDVVAGIRTPQQLTILGKDRQKSKLASMEEAMPETFAQLCDIRVKLERHYRDIQDIEFTVEKGKLYMLQTRNGKRTAAAALRIAVELAEEGLIDRKTAVGRIDPSSLDQLLHPTLDPKAAKSQLTRGLPASPGAASGIVTFSADEAETLAGEGKAVILVRVETSPEDIHGMHAARGILTTRGGMTSHAAVVARGMGRACVAGAGEIRVDYAAKTMSVRGTIIKAGEALTIDGGTGDVFKGEVPTVQPELSGHFATIMEWADSFRRMKVRTNAETPLDARTARRFGAEGIGLCRTEHMFFDPSRITAVREMIVADDASQRAKALAKIQPFQRDDFAELFRIMDGLPVTIRLLGSAFARIPAAFGCGFRRTFQGDGQEPGRIEGARREAHRDEPDAGPSRLPSRGHLSRNLPDASARDFRSLRDRRQGIRPQGRARDHDPAGGDEARTRSDARSHREGRGRSARGHGRRDFLHARHDDRVAARGVACGRNRGDGGVLLLRHQ